MDLIPNFPNETGEDAAVTFMKDGAEYRILRHDNTHWLIQKRGDAQFALTVAPSGPGRWDVEGTGHFGSSLYASYASTGELFSKLF